MALKPTIIDWDTGLKARALFYMGANSYKKASEFEGALAELLGLGDGNYCGCLSDAMIDGNSGFDAALKNSGFVIAPPKKRK